MLLPSDLQRFPSRSWKCRWACLYNGRWAYHFLIAACASLKLSGQVASSPDSSDAQAILRRAMVALDRSDSLRTLYTYREFTEERSLDSGGKPKETHTKLQEILYLGEHRYQHLLAKDGEPLAGASAQREEQRMRRAVSDAEKLTPEQRTALREKAERERHQNNEFWKYVPAAYNVVQSKDDAISGRPAYVLLLTPKRDYKGKYSSFLTHVQARLFVDKQDDMLARLDADMIDDVSVGFVLARINKGTHFSYELTRINNEVWLPKLVDLQGSIRFLLKSLRGEEKTTFSDYRKYQADSRIVATSVP